MSETGATPPDSVWAPAAAGVLSVEARNPNQFVVGQRYRLSVDVSELRSVYHATLLGYESE